MNFWQDVEPAIRAMAYISIHYAMDGEEGLSLVTVDTSDPTEHPDLTAELTFGRAIGVAGEEVMDGMRLPPIKPGGLTIPPHVDITLPEWKAGRYVVQSGWALVTLPVAMAPPVLRMRCEPEAQQFSVLYLRYRREL